MFKKALVATTAALLAVSLSACDGDSPDNVESTSTEANDYRGEKVTCIKEGSGSNRAITCDYAAFYAEHADLLGQSVEEAKDADTIAEVWWTTYQGEKMPCYSEGSGKSRILSCDYDWYYAMNPITKD